MQIFKRDIKLQENQGFIGLTFKFPWYNSEDKLVGVFGCSINMNREAMDLPLALQEIIRIGLLVPNYPMTLTPNYENNNSTSKIIFPSLTARELECFHLIARGLTAKEIAKELNLSFRTIHSHCERLKAKFDCRRKKELLIYYREYVKQQKNNGI